jgi:hypothetical protein
MRDQCRNRVRRDTLTDPSSLLKTITLVDGIALSLAVVFMLCFYYYACKPLPVTPIIPYYTF